MVEALLSFDSAAEDSESVREQASGSYTM